MLVSIHPEPPRFCTWDKEDFELLHHYRKFDCFSGRGLTRAATRGRPLRLLETSAVAGSQRCCGRLPRLRTTSPTTRSRNCYGSAANSRGRGYARERQRFRPEDRLSTQNIGP